MYSELRTKIGKGKETVGVVETLLVFTMAAFYFAVVAGRVWTDQLVPDPLSVCTHSTRTPRRLNQAAIFSRKSAEE